MDVNEKTIPYSIGECKWDEESEVWLFSWGEEIPPEWVVFSITHEMPVESINEAYEKNPTDFELNVSVIEEILAED